MPNKLVSYWNKYLAQQQRTCAQVLNYTISIYSFQSKQQQNLWRSWSIDGANFSYEIFIIYWKQFS